MNDELSKKIFEEGIRQWALQYLLTKVNEKENSIDDMGIELIKAARPICQKMFRDVIGKAKEQGLVK